MTIESLALREERAQLVAQAKTLLDKVESERRNLTAAEAQKFDEIMREVNDLAEKVNIIELEDGRPASYQLKQYWTPAECRQAVLDGQRPMRIIAGNVDDNGPIRNQGEARLLGPEDSYYRALSERGVLKQVDYKNLSIGAFMRAAITGARTEQESRALSAGTDSAGGFTVPDVVVAQYIDRLRAASVTTQAGIRTLPLDERAGRWTIARLESDPVATWRLENAPVAESNPTFGALALEPRSLAVLIKTSRELLTDGVNIEDMLEHALTESLAGELDRIVLFGSGTAPEPRGLRHTSGVAAISSGTNGGAVTWDAILDARQAVLNANAPAPAAVILHSRTQTSLSKLKDSQGAYLTPPAAMEQVRLLSTNKIPTNETQGSGTNLTRLFIGHWPFVILGLRAQLRIEILKETFAANLQYAFLAHLRADVGIAQPAGFAMVTNINN